MATTTTTMATTTTTMATPPPGTDIGSDEEASLIEYAEGLEFGRVPDYMFLKSWGVQRLKVPPRMLRQGIDWQAFWLDDETIDEYWRLLVERHDMIRNLASSQQPPPRCVFLASNTVMFRDPKARLPEHWADADKFVRSLGSDYTQHWTLGVVNLITKRLEHYDSAAIPVSRRSMRPHWDLLQEMGRYVWERWPASRGPRPNIYEWPVVDMVTTPLQTNVCDCGPYICQFANCITIEAPLWTTQGELHGGRLDIIRAFKNHAARPSPEEVVERLARGSDSAHPIVALDAAPDAHDAPAAPVDVGRPDPPVVPTPHPGGQAPCTLIKHLFWPQTKTEKKQKKHIRDYNNACQMASSTVKWADVNRKGRGPSVLRIQGQPYHLNHLFNPLDAGHNPTGKPQYIQLFLLDESKDHWEASLAYSTGANRQSADSNELGIGIVEWIRSHNPFAQQFMTIFEQIRKYPNPEKNLAFKVTYMEEDSKVWNRPTLAGELFAVVDKKAFQEVQRATSATGRDIVLLARMRPAAPISGRKATVKDVPNAVVPMMGAYFEPLRMPLFYPRGESGWYMSLKNDNGRRITQLEYVRWHMHYRVGTRVPHIFGGRLYQEWLITVFLRYEVARLSIYATNKYQMNLRGSKLSSVKAAVGDGVTSGADAGSKIQIPSSHVGSMRWYRAKKADSLILINVFGIPTLFITMTCNPNWPEIVDAMKQQGCDNPCDRPDITERVLDKKANELIKDIYERQIFGKCVAFTGRKEWQKRGLPHAHLLFWLDAEAIARLSTPTGIDEIVQAEIPPFADHEARKLVTAHMLHSCQARGRNSTRGCYDEPGPNEQPRSEDSKCDKKFPKNWQHVSCQNPDGYALPRRRKNREEYVDDNGKRYDNRYVVPHNLYLLKKYHCHINVEVCSSIHAIKYVFKYVYKNVPMANLEIAPEDLTESMKHFLGLAIGSTEAACRLLGLGLCWQSPSVARLALHLPGDQFITYHENANLEAVAENKGEQDSQLTAFFKFNMKAKTEYERSLMPGMVPIERPKQLDVTYADAYSVARYNKQLRRWQLRKKDNGLMLGRMNLASFKDLELWCLRRLLFIVKGPTGWSDLKTVVTVTDGTVGTLLCETFQEACARRGLLRDDSLYTHCMTAALTQDGRQLRELFAQIWACGDLTDPLELWHKFKRELSDDLIRRYEDNVMRPSRIAQDDRGEWAWEALDEIRHLLSNYNIEYERTGLPPIPNLDITEADVRERTENMQYIAFHNFSYEDIQRNIDNLNLDQRAAYNAIIAAVGQGVGPTFYFIDGPGGTGKTFLWKTLLLKVRHDPDTEHESPIALAVASSGLASQLLPCGTTVHKRFLLPVIDDMEGIECNMPVNSNHAKLLKRAKLIIWDEAPCMHAQQLDAIDECLRGLMGVDKPFGGKVFVLGGDFRQTGPVVRHRNGCGRRTAQVAHTLTSSEVWQHVTTMQLTQNMRVQNCISSGDAEKAERFQDFARDLLAVGNGTYRFAGRAVPTESTSKMQIPPYVVWKPPTGEEHSPDAFFDFIYSPMRKQDGESDEVWEVRRNQYLWSTAVLVSRNIEATEINHRLLDDLLPDGPSYTFYSSNEVRNSEGYEHDWTEEYLAGVSDAGLPPHEIRLKVGAPIIAMRNITKGVVNGTRMIVTWVDPSLKLIKAKLLSESGTRPKGSPHHAAPVHDPERCVHPRTHPAPHPPRLCADHQQGAGPHPEKGRPLSRQRRLRPRTGVRGPVQMWRPRQAVRLRQPRRQRRTMGRESRIQRDSTQLYMSCCV